MKIFKKFNSILVKYIGVVIICFSIAAFLKPASFA